MIPVVPDVDDPVRSIFAAGIGVVGSMQPWRFGRSRMIVARHCPEGPLPPRPTGRGP